MRFGQVRINATAASFYAPRYGIENTPRRPGQIWPAARFHYICKIMGDIPGNPERRLPQGSPPPFAQNRSNMAIFKVEGGRRLRGEITPQGAKNEALQILCATLLTQER